MNRCMEEALKNPNIGIFFPKYLCSVIIILYKKLIFIT